MNLREFLERLIDLLENQDAVAHPDGFGQLEESVRTNPETLDYLVEIVRERQLSPITLRALIPALASRNDSAAANDLFIELLAHPDSDVARDAANRTFNLAQTSAAVRNGLLDTARRISPETPEQVAVALVSALGAVPSAEAAETLFTIAKTGPGKAKAAALNVLSNSVLRSVSTQPLEPSTEISRSSEIIGRTESRAIRLNSINVVAGIVEEILENEREDTWARVAALSITASLEGLRGWVETASYTDPPGAVRALLNRLADAYTELHPLAKMGADYGLQIALRALLSTFGINLP